MPPHTDKPRAFPPLYAIVDAALLPSPDVAAAVAMAELLAGAGVELLQYRNKRAGARELFDISKALVAALARYAQSCGAVNLAARHGARGGKAPNVRVAVEKDAPRLIVNDRADVALLTGAGGVHLGQTDLGVEQARAVIARAMRGNETAPGEVAALEKLPPSKDGAVSKVWVGVSTHNLDQLAAADKTSADYIAFGPIFPTTTKENPDPVVGLAGLAEARKLTKKPLVAIGGITLDRALDVYRAGADCLCVVRDLICAADPVAQARAFLRIAADLRRA